MDRDRPQRKRLRLQHFDYSNPNYVYFVTLCSDKQTKPFSNLKLAEEVIACLHYRRDGGDIKLYCYCLMPDHLHLALSPRKSLSVSEIIKSFKSFTTKLSWGYGREGKLWQRSFYDHIARTREDLLEICEYILLNPVRKGLVKRTVDWPYSGIVDPLPR